MDASPDFFMHAQARAYQAMQADFPGRLRPDRLDVEPDRRQALFDGLGRLHALIARIYAHFASLDPALMTRKAAQNDREACYTAIEAPLRLLWALGSAGRLETGEGGPAMRAEKAALEAAAKSRQLKNPAAALDALTAAGLILTPLGADGEPCRGSYKACQSLRVTAAGGAEDGAELLAALVFYAGRVRSGTHGVPIEVFMRADFRPCLPGYRFEFPHVDADESEVERTMAPAARELWREVVRFASERYPRLRLYYRIPRLRSHEWIGDFGVKATDYGFWSILAQEEGLRLRLVLRPSGRRYLLDHIGELSPTFQEMFLDSIPCRDCTHCGEEVYFQHGDHAHRLCKIMWFVSPPLAKEQLPDVRALVDMHMSHLR